MKIIYPIFLGFSFLADSASAKTIDLDLPALLYGPTYSQDGFTFAYSPNNPDNPNYYPNRSQIFTNWIKRGAPNYNANGDNATLANNYTYLTNILYASDQSNFSFDGISLADTFNSNYDGNVDFIFNYAVGGSRTQTITLQKTKGLQEFNFSEKGLISVAIRATSTKFNSLQFDFVKVNSEVFSSVPEPSAWILMLTGFGAIGYSTRQHRKQILRRQAV